MSCYQPRPRPLAQSSSILPGPRLALPPHLYSLRLAPPLLLHSPRHYLSAYPDTPAGLRLSIHPRFTLLLPSSQLRLLPRLVSLPPLPRPRLTTHRSTQTRRDQSRHNLCHKTPPRQTNPPRQSNHPHHSQNYRIKIKMSMNPCPVIVQHGNREKACAL